MWLSQGRRSARIGRTCTGPGRRLGPSIRRSTMILSELTGYMADRRRVAQAKLEIKIP